MRKNKNYRKGDFFFSTFSTFQHMSHIYYALNNIFLFKKFLKFYFCATNELRTFFLNSIFYAKKLKKIQ